MTGPTRAAPSMDSIAAALAASGYIATTAITTTMFLALRLQKPVLVEGPAGVGKTELAQSLARGLDLPLVRLQCYEGLDEAKALYEWKYAKQLLYTQILKEKIADLTGETGSLSEALAALAGFQDVFFSRAFLEPRPILRALEDPRGAVLLIDEIDKSDEEFEALLLEVLAENQVTVPEIGTIKASVAPLVVLTSNATRELGDALKRRCLHLYIDFPDSERERRIVRARAPGISEQMLREVVAFVQRARSEKLRKLPSVSETVDWARTMVLMNADVLSPELVRDTLGVLLKRQADVAEVTDRIDVLTARARADAAGAG